MSADEGLERTPCFYLIPYCTQFNCNQACSIGSKECKPATTLNPAPDSRSSCDLDAGHSVLEAVGPEAGDVLIAHLHLASLEVHTLVHADLMVLHVLEEALEKDLVMLSRRGITTANC